MTLEFKLPDLGEGVAEGEIIKWLVKEGQQIKEDEPMVEVMTDKATVQIPSPTSGIVKQILAKEGQTIKVGTNLVVLDNGGERNPIGKPGLGGVTPTPRIEEPPREFTKTEPLQPATQSVPSHAIIATPATRKLARELGVDIERVNGSGPGGRVMEEDVRTFGKPEPIRQQMMAATEQTAAKLQGHTEKITPPIMQAPAHVAMEREERIPIHGIRKRISEKMFKSSKETAAVTHIDEVDFTELIALREATKPLAEEKKVKLTYLPFIVKAVVSALEQFPFFNASIDEEKQEFVIKHYHNIGIATDTTNGLIVPVIKDADKKNIIEIAKEIERLSEDAREGKIQLQDLQGGTFTITNIGTLGGVISTPIINIPEVAILGVHKIQKKPVVRNDVITIRQMAFVALTFDHRIVDGADAARFTSMVIRYLENPSLIFVEATLAS